MPQVRHLESMIRMSEARAAMHLREYVGDEDIDNAIRWVGGRALLLARGLACCGPARVAALAVAGGGAVLPRSAPRIDLYLYLAPAHPIVLLSPLPPNHTTHAPTRPRTFLPALPPCLPACRIMLESFVATQKLSVQKALRRKFRRYISAKSDFNGLVLLKLQVGGLAGQRAG